jgi:exodeoxyribonuclease V beta subunit
VLSFTSLSRVKDAAGDGHARDVGQSSDRGAGRRAPCAPLDRLLRDTGLQGSALGVLVHDALADVRAFACLAAGAPTQPLADRLAFEARGLRVSDAGSLVRLARGLQEGLAAPTGDDGIPTVARLADDPSCTLRELGLTVPWLGAPAALADALREARTAWSDAVADAVARADRATLQGVLIGFVDLVALHEGRWFIHDYKTNFLGDDPAAYEGARLDDAMADALYPLQAAVYALMLARWLEARGVDDAFDGAIGGVAYLFLRGMDPASGARGTWTWRPSTRLLRALDAALPRPPAEARA